MEAFSGNICDKLYVAGIRSESQTPARTSKSPKRCSETFLRDKSEERSQYICRCSLEKNAGNSNLYTGNKMMAGLGIFIHIPQPSSQHLFFAARSMASSPLQAEALGLELAGKIAHILSLQDPNFFTDNQMVALQVQQREQVKSNQNWEIMPQINQFLQSTAQLNAKTYKINRGLNNFAHREAQVAYSQNSDQHCIFTCMGISHDRDNCPVVRTL